LATLSGHTPNNSTFFCANPEIFSRVLLRHRQPGMIAPAGVFLQTGKHFVSLC